MTTVAQSLLRKAREKREMAQNLYDDIEEIESNFMGMELEYEGHFACVEFINIMNDQVILYVDASTEGKGEWDESLTLDELAELL